MTHAFTQQIVSMGALSCFVALLVLDPTLIVLIGIIHSIP